MQTLFHLGQVVVTPGAVEALNRSQEWVASLLRRHVSGDWGEVDPVDAAANYLSLIEGYRIVSVYETRLGEKVWVITDAIDDINHRTSTCVLTPMEY